MKILNFPQTNKNGFLIYFVFCEWFTLRRDRSAKLLIMFDNSRDVFFNPAAELLQYYRHSV